MDGALQHLVIRIDSLFGHQTPIALSISFILFFYIFYHTDFVPSSLSNLLKIIIIPCGFSSVCCLCVTCPPRDTLHMVMPRCYIIGYFLILLFIKLTYIYEMILGINIFFVFFWLNWGYFLTHGVNKVDDHFVSLSFTEWIIVLYMNIIWIHLYVYICSKLH